MKNLIPTVLLFLLSFVGYIQAQCPISVNLSLDSTCLYIAWEDDLEVPDTILLFGDTFSNRYDLQTGFYGYTNLGTLICSDTNGMQSIVGSLSYSIGEEDYTCTFDEGIYIPPCPDSAFTIDETNCLVLVTDSTNAAQLPDTINIGEIEYLFHTQTNNELIYSEIGVACVDGDRTAFNGTLAIGPSACEFDSGILPITILAFDVDDRDGVL